jgi:ribosomal protein S18 acetylase RimI-like enzyme
VTDLVPMTGAAFVAFVEETVPAYAADKVASGQWREDEAIALSRKELEGLLPQGLATPGHHLYTLREVATGTAVGRLWIAEQARAGSKVAYVYDVAIFPAHQRKGHATRAFEALESEVRALGLEGIALHVFGHNRGAQALYEKLGYRATNIHMFKGIAKTDSRV